MAPLKTSLKPAKTKSLLWGLFSGTATYSAFILPAFILGTVREETFFTGPIWLIKIYTGATLFCALYHSLYRVKTLGHDLDLGYAAKVLTFLSYLLIISGTCAIIAAMLLT